MKYLHKHIFVLLLFVFSATNYCMEENLELKPYEPNTIENIKKQRENFIQSLHSTETDLPGLSYIKFMFREISSKKDKFYVNGINLCFNDHSMLSAILLNPYVEKIEKINRIYEVRYINIYCIKIQPTPRDLQFAELELYERRYALKHKIMLCYKTKPHIENITQQQFPHEIMRHIGMLTLDTEKSLL